VAVLAAALAVGLLGPPAMRQLRLRRDERVAEHYRQASRRLSLLELGTMLAEARAYDEAREPFRWEAADRAPDEAYGQLLDPAGSGAMAVLEIPKLGLTAPVWHGSGSAPQARVEHLPASSLPVGSPGGMCVLRAPRIPRLYEPFSDLDRLMPGDCFTLRALQDTLTYEVARLSDEPPAPQEEEEADWCVLTAPGREGGALYLIARRIAREDALPVDDTRALPGWAQNLILALPAALVGLALLALIEGPRRALLRHRRRRMKL